VSNKCSSLISGVSTSNNKRGKGLQRKNIQRPKEAHFQSQESQLAARKERLHSQKDREKEMLQKHGNFKANIIMFINMYDMALTNYNNKKKEKMIIA
jgi:hypothetical protein